MSASSQLQAAWWRKGVLARLLLPLAWLYGTLVAARHAAYRMGVARSVRLPVPIVVVGNFIAGGAGKTPTCIALVRLLRDRGYTPGVISRGYGRQTQDILLIEAHTPVHVAGDEPLLIHLRTQAPVAVGADRIAAARALLHAHPGIDILVSDDGLQHLRLARDAQVIVFDERGAGNGWLLPAGPLRERMPGRLPPRSVVLYNAEAPSTALPGHVASRKLNGLVQLAEWWAGQPARPAAFTELQGRQVLAVAGLAWPRRFFNMLRAQGLAIEERGMPDHHAYAQLPWAPDTADVVVTEKDAIKIKPDRIGQTRVWVAPLDFQPSPAFASDLMQWLPAPPPT